MKTGSSPRRLQSLSQTMLAPHFSSTQVPRVQSLQGILHNNLEEEVYSYLCSSFYPGPPYRLQIDSFDSVPIDEDIVQFFTTITSHMTSSMGHIPRYSNQVRYLKLHITKLIFTYPQFTLTPHERNRISIGLKSLLRESRLTNDPQRATQWVGISLVKRMVKAMVEDAVTSGTR